MTKTSGLHPVTAVKCPTRIITYAWGETYVDALLTLTLPALLAPGNLPYVASEVPCQLVILTERRFFSKFDRHPTIAQIRKLCPIRLVRLDDLIVSKDKYGMTLTYALHRGFRDLGPAMTEQWQIFLNADFILANGSLRNVIRHLSRGERIVAAPSYCTIAEEAIPELRRQFDSTNSILSVPPRELARLVLQHRHVVIQGKTVNQSSFHMRYADQFYWSVDDGTLIGYQMPVSIVGLRPERYVAEPNSYWDFGLIWEYCPQAKVCVIGDSDELLMLELRDKRVAEDQVVPGPANKQEIAERMVTWVTPYQRHFLDFPLTLHDRDLPPDIDDARANLRAFVDEVMSHTPPLLSHIKHSQWEYHWADFQAARRLSNRIRSWGKARLEGLAPAVISFARVIQTAATCIARVIQTAMTCVARVIQTAVTSFARMIRTAVTSFARMTQRTLWNTLRLPLRVKARTIELRAKRKMIEKCKPFARVVGERYVRLALRRLGLEIIRSTNLLAIQEKVNEANLRASEATLKAREVADLKRQQQAEREEMTRLKRQQQAEREEMTRLKQQQQAEREEMSRLKHEQQAASLKLKEVTGLKQQQQAEREEMTRLKRQQQAEREGMTGLKRQQQAERKKMTRLKRQQQAEREEMTRLKQQQQVEREKISDLSNIAAEYQFKLERTYDYQTLMMEDQIRAGMRDLEPEFLALYEQCREYTMTSWERLYALYKSVQYTVENGIPGAFVECGVWRGGSMKLVAHVLHFLGDTKRTLFLYDTFEGMTEPDPEVDVDFSGNAAANDWRQVQRRGVKWAYAPVEEVHKIIATSGYPMNMVKFVKGRVEETIPGTIPVSIALLRLDTDWYSSTKHEMEHLYPKLSSQGILILDDYGHYQGARRAVDEYLSKLDKKPLLQRVDYSCRLAVKPTA